MRGGRTETEKIFPVVGDVRPYGGAYQGGTGGQTGVRENGKVWNV